MSSREGEAILVTRRWLRENQCEDAARHLLRILEKPWFTEDLLDAEMDIIYRSNDNDERLSQDLFPTPVEYLQKLDKK